MRKYNIDNYKITMKKLAICKDYFLALEKALFGFISHSPFMWINALYSIFLGTAGIMCIKNMKSNHKKQVIIYKRVAILLILASIVYTV